MMVRSGTRINCTFRYAHASGTRTYGTVVARSSGILVPVRTGTSAVLVVASSSRIVHFLYGIVAKSTV